MLGTEIDQLETVVPATHIAGTLRVPGDKSIAHRALILGALADGDSIITGLPEGQDVRATVAGLRSLGVRLSPVSPRGSGWGLRVSPAPSWGQSGWGFATPHGPLDCANSGTTMRLLAGLLAGSRVSATLDGDASLRRRPMARIIEPRPSPRPLRPLDLGVPGDVSSAAFWMAAAAMRPGWSVTIQGVGLNPTRTAFLRLLEAMGAEVVVELASAEIEPLGSVTVVGHQLHAIEVGPADVAAAVDEIPALIAVATQAVGVTRIDGAAELRLKESDRIAGMADGLRRMGTAVDERPDGISVHGRAPLRGATVSSNGDHRIAMALAIAGLTASGPTTIEDADCVAVSYPDFFTQLRAITGEEA